MVGALSSAYQNDVLPFWLLFGATFLPCVLFIFVKPNEELPLKAVSYLHLFGVLWYLMSMGISLFLTYGSIATNEWLFYLAFMCFGLIPCFSISRKLVAGEYREELNK